ncbi:MAG: DegT/DnrJ/EryC1/StrS family aminotransferase [Cyclobacteriaceae bacterium]|nr:DegT/DnrJ/EryC1/StrS family aminotransferase [Cyclobacteriaceae bacterium]MCB0500990.1 DegT/DnrJ/EryC1/StrS family aminotransferase [Cyclobacteriaceae bacterium]MCO5273244.1 DegT/DnrJ/EryC1/StrS family aminotransferase [Cyclobacteriaceae bacterium]
MKRERIYLSPPHIGEEEFKNVKEAFDTNWIAPVGPHINQFELELQQYLGVPHCVVLTSGTAAIHLALIILGVGRGDEVACSSFTFAGSCNPIVYQGATPVFIDSERETWNMDPGLLEMAIRDRIAKGKKPKAIICVHLYGMPAQVDRIVAIAGKYEIPLIEDAAEALGSTYKGKKLGAFGAFGILSFNGNKIITSSGGGALLTRNKKWADKARFLATQAREPFPHYEHNEIGYNYRLSNVSAAIGRGQLSVIDKRVEQRRMIFKKYAEELKDIAAISFQPENKEGISNRWLTTLVIDPALCNGVTNESIRIALEQENIESRPLWKPMHKQPVYAQAPFYGNGVSEALFESGLCLPSGTNLAPTDQELILDILRKNLQPLT